MITQFEKIFDNAEGSLDDTALGILNFSSLHLGLRNENLAVSKSVEIEVHPERCTGCSICQLRCSFAYTPNVFNPSKARIVIDTTDGRKIRFTEECNNCGLCARFCVYGALEIKGDA